MRKVCNLFFSFILCIFCIACTQSAATETYIIQVETFSTPTVTALIIPTATLVPPTITPSLSCDPHFSDFCVVDGTFHLQVPIPDSGIVTVDRSYPYATTSGGSRSPHLGVEFYNPSGTPVLAAGDGTVKFAGDDLTTQFTTATNVYGNLIIIEHTLGSQAIYSLYAHLSKINVVIGQVVSQGEKIGEVGSTGASIGSHLHFEIRLDYSDYTTTLNPELWLHPLENTGVLAMQFMDESGNYLPVRTNVQYFPEGTEVFTSAWQPEPYSPDLIHAYAWENIAIGNIASGSYRISYFWEGVLFDRWVEIESGKLTLAEFLIR